MSNYTLSSQASKQTVRSGRCSVFVPRSYHVMLVKHDSTERITSLTTQNLKVYYRNLFTGEVEHETTLHLRQPVELFFTQARNFPGYAYVQHYADRLERFSCSCKEGKDCGSCPHIEELTNLYAPEAMEV